ncbi:uncharacterized protein LOC110700740 [Chenopodium quinoa]|uniref:uncharacterized protein LOC110700740 n=1 Tax=Chenopodium quinoa TaxID=63459 RepID=UPI000B785A8F|nr:uncharacterized protein LOC110700740 [Chenopodium quinoa]
MWLSKEECTETVSKAWKEGEGCAPHQRIALCAKQLTKWATKSFGELKKKISKCEAALQEAQGAQIDARMLDTCEKLAEEINELRRMEESYWYTRSRANEMRDGDKNTAYFHRKASQRKKKNRIDGLFDLSGEWRTDEGQIRSIISEYFGSLFSTDNPTDFATALEGVERVVSDDMNNVMCSVPSSEEIKNALFQMHPNKAPGTDGPDIVTLVKNWWKGLVDISDINKTCIVLIPKCNDPNAFIPRRLITDNAMIVFEIFHSMKRGGEGRDGTVALKLDMSKAYDRVEWSFLKMVMCKMGFSELWIRRVMECISSVSFPFKVNDEIFGSVAPSRGLRQGDPISPYLFLLCADAFSCLLSKAAHEKKLRGARICKAAPRVSHLFFADDSILFAKATLQECSKIADITRVYERASGQKVNLDKTEVAFSKCVSIERRQEIVDTLGVREVDRHEKYLGLPTIIGKSKKAIFAFLKERNWKKLSSWKEKLLSRQGKEVLIKAVAQAIPTYIMSMFKIPEGLIDEIHKLLCRFWWGSTVDQRKMHWKSWERLCLPKAKGGLGFRDLKCFNQALLAKQRSIWGAKGLLRDDMVWRVGNGIDIKVWSDAWLVKDGRPSVLLRPAGVDDGMLVRDLMVDGALCWDAAKVRELLDDESAAAVLSTPLPQHNKANCRYWSYTKNGIFSVKTTYWLARSVGNEVVVSSHAEELWSSVWKMSGPPKLKHFIWSAVKGNLAVMDRLVGRHVREDASCQVCGDQRETIIHSLFHCTAASEIWSHSGLADQLVDAPTDSFLARWSWLQGKVDGQALKCMATLMWAAWRCRNLIVFENETPNFVLLAAGFCKLVSDYDEYAKKVFLPIPQPSVGSSMRCGYAGLGVVFRDENGGLLLTTTKRTELSSPECIEAQAVRYALTLARRFGHRNVWVESDAINVIKAIVSRASGFSPIHIVYDDIMLDRAWFNVCLFSHAKRSCNTVAHLVARGDTGDSLEVVRFSAFPQSIITLAELDLSS